MPAVVASYGVTLTVRPSETACLACALESGSPSAENGGSHATDTGARTGVEDTCDTVGVLGAAAGVIASIEAAEAIKLFVGKIRILGRPLISFDVWSGRFPIRSRGAKSGVAAPACSAISDISKAMRSLT